MSGAGDQAVRTTPLGTSSRRSGASSASVAAADATTNRSRGGGGGETEGGGRSGGVATEASARAAGAGGGTGAVAAAGSAAAGSGRERHASLKSARASDLLHLLFGLRRRESLHDGASKADPINASHVPRWDVMGALARRCVHPWEGTRIA